MSMYVCDWSILDVHRSGWGGTLVGRGGRKGVGYDQFTAVQINEVPKEQLLKWNVYPSQGESKKINLILFSC